jgi:hypothetical protein
MFTRAARWIVGGVSARKWINAILGSLYMMKSHKEDKKEDGVDENEIKIMEGGEKEIIRDRIPSDATIASHKSINLRQAKADLRFVNPKEKKDYYRMKANIEGPAK